MQTKIHPILARGGELARRGLARVQPTHVRRLAVATTIGMFLVLIQGTLVTTTGSGHGCGNSWPLCQGKFIPSLAIASAIEFSHRAITGLETFLVLGMAAGVLWFWRARREIRILAPLMVVFLFLQAALGALVVLLDEPPEALALHFGVSLISFVSILLTSLLIHEFDGWDRLRDRAVPSGFRWLALGLTGYTYIVVYLGAYVRHRHVELACDQWPGCRSGPLTPELAASVGVVMAHRIAALLLVVGVGWLFLWARRLRDRRPDLYRGSLWTLAAVLAQALEGALIVWTRLSDVSALLHASFVALLFGALCYVSLHTLPRPADASVGAERAASATDVRPAPSAAHP